MGKHLTHDQRHTISVMLETGCNQKEIAVAIGRDKSVISREISRNQDLRSGKYKYKLACKKSDARKKNKPKNKRFTDDIKLTVQVLLSMHLSPEQISGWTKKHGIACVSHEAIYQYIWQDKSNGGTYYTFLRRKQKRYRKRGQSKDTRGIIKDRVGIENRPTIVDKKERIGDLEIDTIIGKNHKGAMLTINDRRTGRVWIRLLQGKEADDLTKKAIEALAPFKSLIHTITADNGKEFSNHKEIAKGLDVSVFFARPYHSWERGANENTNGLIREFFPKGSSFEEVTDEDVKRVESILNNRPRKRLDYSSPMEVWSQLTKPQEVAFVA